MRIQQVYAQRRLYSVFLSLSITILLNSSNLHSQAFSVNYNQQMTNAFGIPFKTVSHGDSLVQKEKRIIVEFHGETLTKLYRKSYAKSTLQQKAQLLIVDQDRQFEQFDKELDKLQKQGYYFKGKKKDFNINPAPGRKYRQTFLGQQLTVDSLMISYIEALPFVKAVHPDRVVKATLDESVPQIHADKVWNQLDSEGDSVRVGIIDTGIDYLHPDLGGGYGPGYKVIGGYDFVNEDEDPMDDYEHGTHVAGIVAADGSVIGVAPGALLYALKVLDEKGGGYESDIIAAIEWCVDPNGDMDISDHLDIVNMSLGGKARENDPMSDAVEAATSLGVTFCIAAGNDGSRGLHTIGSPGISPSAITVGAVDKENGMAGFSSMGPVDFTDLPKPDLAAPGVGINSTVLGQEYKEHSGTSMASPHVAGVCALIKKLHPEWGPAEIKSALMLTARDINASILAQGSGIVNAYRATLCQIMVDKTMLSYGLDSLTSTENWIASDSILLTNLSSESKTYTMEAMTSISGINLSFPASLSLDPGESLRIPIDIEVVNTSLGEVPRGEKYFYADKIRISSNTDTVNLSWSFMKGYKLNFDFGNDLMTLLVLDKKELVFRDYRKIRFPVPNILLKSGTYFIIAELKDTLKSGSGCQYTIFKEIDVDQNTNVVLDSREAKKMLVFDTEDKDGMKFTDDLAKHRKVVFELPGEIVYTKYVSSKMTDEYKNYCHNEWGELRELVSVGSGNDMELLDESTFRVMDTMFYSDLPEGIQLYMGESRRRVSADKSLQFCFNEIGPVAELPDTFILKGEADEYGTLYYRNDMPQKRINWNTYLFYKKETQTQGFEISTEDDLLETYYSVSMPSKPDLKRETFLYFMMQRDLDFMCSPVQYLDEQFVIGNGKTAGALYFENGDTVNMLASPWYASILDGSDTYSKIAPNGSYLIYFPDHQGGMRTFNPFQFSSMAYLLNDQGDTLTKGEFLNYKNIPGKYKIGFNTYDGEKLYGLSVKNQVEAWIDSRREDHSPPYLRYMHQQNSKGRYTSFVQKGDSVNIIFTLSSGEVMRGAKKTGEPVPFDSVMVYTKHHDDNEWIQLETDSLGYDFREGLACSSRFSLSQYDSAFFDLKMVFSDFAGNKTQNIISPALYVRSIQTPIANDDSYAWTVGRKFSSDNSILDNDVDPWGWEGYLTFDLLTDVSNGLLNMRTNGMFTYEPEEDFAGTDQFTYRIRNERYFSAPATVTLRIDIPENTINWQEAKSENAWIYPNPANEMVNIGLKLKTNDNISVDIYSITGSHMSNVHTGVLSAGKHTFQWNRMNNQAETIKSGIYFVRIRSTRINQTLILIIE